MRASTMASGLGGSEVISTQTMYRAQLKLKKTEAELYEVKFPLLEDWVAKMAAANPGTLAQPLRNCTHLLNLPLFLSAWSSFCGPMKINSFVHPNSHRLPVQVHT